MNRRFFGTCFISVVLLFSCSNVFGAAKKGKEVQLLLSNKDVAEMEKKLTSALQQHKNSIDPSKDKNLQKILAACEIDKKTIIDLSSKLAFLDYNSPENQRRRLADGLEKAAEILCSHKTAISVTSILHLIANPTSSSPLEENCGISLKKLTKIIAEASLINKEQWWDQTNEDSGAKTLLRKWKITQNANSIADSLREMYFKLSLNRVIFCAEYFQYLGLGNYKKLKSVIKLDPIHWRDSKTFKEVLAEKTK